MSAPSDPVRIETVDIEAFATNLARMIEEGGKALAAYLKPREDGKPGGLFADDITDAVRTLGQVAQYWTSDPQRALAMQTSLGRTYLDLWGNAMLRMTGQPLPPVAEPDPKDRRFADPEWSNNQFFDFMKQAYLLTVKWADHLVEQADSLDPHTRKKAEFYIQQISNAVAPSNFVLTNPELWRETLTSNAENLVRGMKLLSKDIEAGGGDLRISQTDASTFRIGENIAATPGKVVFENELMQLIQYEPTTESVHKVPLLIVPPWINKFYILDLTPEKSFIKWCVDQGLTVFVISWVNPDARHAAKSFDDYMQDGPLAALDAIKQATGEAKVHAIGYCVGGTLLAITLAWLAAKRKNRVISATFFTAQVDFSHAGDLKIFIDENQIAALEKQMAETGFLDGAKMANTFNMLRANDLIWPYVINNYLKGKEPVAFDLLYWNSDSTRMPAANHSFYLRSCYLENRLAKGEMEIGGERIDLGRIKTPAYMLATREDHIAPAKSVFIGAQMFGGPVKFVLSGSGHIAGVVNPVAKMKYQYWTGAAPRGDDIEPWLAKAREHPGSWWPDWLKWVTGHDAVKAEVKPRIPGKTGKLKAIEDAPGSYVKG
ncbi:MAG TPA: class I poly(R)-hydroxyalkanoic acid synthase [Xanthobacteraceae bacterium]|nr:class I poly(R)-hydroxyalkanoic acid synthase [Xanthobacteraceae bacterium]